jgi:hypothetical protein
MAKTVEERTKQLRSIESEHTKLAEKMLMAAEGSVYPMDILTAAVLKRSVSLLVGFCDLIEKRNFVAAAPLLRLQLDNVLRFQGAWLVRDPHQFAQDILAGKRVRDLRDRDGQKMTDAYLLQNVSKEYPDFNEAYDHLSGYVHLSDKHIFNVMKLDNDRQFNMTIGPTDSYIEDETYLEALFGFFKVTGVLFRYVQGWIDAKAGNRPPKKSST